MSQVVSYDFPSYLLSRHTVKQKHKSDPVYSVLHSKAPQAPALPPRARTHLGNYGTPFLYQEVAFPVPDNSEDLHSVTLHQCHDYAKAESPRVRYRTNFYRQWAKRQSTGFHRGRGMCTTVVEQPSPPRYRKGNLEALRNYKLLGKHFMHRIKTPVHQEVITTAQPTPTHWTSTESH